MASLTHSDFVSLAEEKFDFDVSLSPASSKGDYDVDDEVFVGPVGHKEKCISHGMKIHVKDSLSSGPSLGEELSWSPLTGEKFDEICKEAHLLASHLEQNITDSVAESSVVSSCQAEETETFEDDTTAKLRMFSKPADVLSPIKRETFLVQDSPMKQLPPAIQKRMLKANGTAGFGKPRLSTSSPLRPAVTQPKMAARGKALVASNGVLPSKPTGHGNSRLSSSTKLPPATKTRLPPPSKGNFGLKRTPCSRNTSRAGSSEDLLSDTTSVASDVSDSSFNTSLPGRSGIPALKKTELRAPSALKAPSLQNSRVVDRRRNTSSSSSSVSSINSSLTISPGSKAKLNSSLNSSTNSISARSHSSVSRLPSSSRKTSVVSRNPEPPVRRTSISTQGRRASELLPRPVKATPIKRTDPFPPSQLQTPAKTTAEKTTISSIPASNSKIGSALKGNPNLKVPVAPTPTNYLRGVRKSEVSSSPDVTRIMKPKKLLSACSVESISDYLVGSPSGLLTPSAMGRKIRRPSALPTPVNRRISGIPAPTPKSVSRLSKSPNVTERSSASRQGTSHLSPENMMESEKQEEKQTSLSNEETCPPVDLQPCSLVFNLEDEPEGSPACEPAVVENPSEPSSCDPEPPQVDMKPLTLPNTVDTQKHHLLKNKEEKNVKEVLLIDAPAPTLQLSEKLLIDLSNTPDLIKTSSAKPWGGQLIDLSSPLIKWSPEDKKENTENSAPLIDLSF